MNALETTTPNIDNLRNADNVELTFRPFHAELEAQKNILAGLEVTRPDQLDRMDAAKEAYKSLGKLEKAVSEEHQRLKEFYLRGGRRIDGLKNEFVAKIKPIREWLKLQSSFNDRLEAERQNKLHAERVALLLPFDPMPQPEHLGKLSDEDFDALMAGSKAITDARLARESVEREAAAERAAEAERLRLENAALREEQEKAAQAAAADRAKLAEAEAATRRAEAEANRVVAEAKRKEDALVAEQRMVATLAQMAKDKAAAAPDYDRVRGAADAVRNLMGELILKDQHLQKQARAILAGCVDSLRSIVP